MPKFAETTGCDIYNAALEIFKNIPMGEDFAANFERSVELMANAGAPTATVRVRNAAADTLQCVIFAYFSEPACKKMMFDQIYDLDPTVPQLDKEEIVSETMSTCLGAVENYRFERFTYAHGQPNHLFPVKKNFRAWTKGFMKPELKKFWSKRKQLAPSLSFGPEEIDDDPRDDGPLDGGLAVEDVALANVEVEQILGLKWVDSSFFQGEAWLSPDALARDFAKAGGYRRTLVLYCTAAINIVGQKLTEPNWSQDATEIIRESIYNAQPYLDSQRVADRMQQPYRADITFAVAEKLNTLRKEFCSTNSSTSDRMDTEYFYWYSSQLEPVATLLDKAARAVDLTMERTYARIRWVSHLTGWFESPTITVEHSADILSLAAQTTLNFLTHRPPLPQPNTQAEQAAETLVWLNNWLNNWPEEQQ
jgi:hypothetical protein